MLFVHLNAHLRYDRKLPFVKLKDSPTKKPDFKNKRMHFNQNKSKVRSSDVMLIFKGTDQTQYQ